MKRITTIITICYLLSILNVFCFAEGMQNNTSDDILTEFNNFIQSESSQMPTEQIAESEPVVQKTLPTIDENFDPNVIIVYLTKAQSALKQQYTKEDFSYLDLEKIEILFEYRPADENEIGLYLYLNNTSKQKVIDAIKLLNQDERVSHAGANYIFTVIDETESESVPNRAIGDTLDDEETSVIQSGICCAHKYTKCETPSIHSKYNAPVKVGIIDSYIHSSLSVMDDKVYAYQDFTEKGVTKPMYMHGSNMASILAKDYDDYSENHSCGNNKYQGVCPNVQLYSLNVTYSTGFETDGSLKINSSIYYFSNVIKYATDNNIRVLNMSFHYPDSSGAAVDIQKAINQYPGIIICAAGNQRANIDSSTGVFPYDFKDSSNGKIIVVGAASYSGASQCGTLYMNSSYGNQKVDLFAYSVAYTFESQYTTEQVNGTDYVVIDTDSIARTKTEGTSNATARVSGAAAVLLNICPELTNAQLRHYLLAGVDPSSYLQNYCVADGTLNVYRSAKMLIADLACDWETVFAGHFTRADAMQVAAYVKTSQSQMKCYVWTYDSGTGKFSDPEHWFTNCSFAMIESIRNQNNMYRSVAGDFDKNGKDEICTLLDWADYLFIEGDGFTSHPGSIGVPVENFTGRVVAGDFDGDKYDEIAALYKVPDVWGHTKLYVWDFEGNGAGMQATQYICYDSGAGGYEASYATDRVVAGDFDGDGKDEVGVLYRYPSSGNYSLQKFDITISGGSASASLSSLIFGASDVDVSKVSGRVAACDYNGGAIDEIICVFDNSATTPDGIINYAAVFGANNTNTWSVTPIYTSGAYILRADVATHLVFAGQFHKDNDGDESNDCEYIGCFYKLPAATPEDVRGKIYLATEPDHDGFYTKWDSKA